MTIGWMARPIYWKMSGRCLGICVIRRTNIVPVVTLHGAVNVVVAVRMVTYMWVW